jgi:hypothetical protein
VILLDELKKLQTKPKNVLTVERSDIIGSALPYFKMPGCEYSPLEIVITTEGVKEQYTDLGKYSQWAPVDSGDREAINRV